MVRVRGGIFRGGIIANAAGMVRGGINPRGMPMRGNPMIRGEHFNVSCFLFGLSQSFCYTVFFEADIAGRYCLYLHVSCVSTVPVPGTVPGRKSCASLREKKCYEIKGNFNRVKKIASSLFRKTFFPYNFSQYRHNFVMFCQICEKSSCYNWGTLFFFSHVLFLLLLFVTKYID